MSKKPRLTIRRYTYHGEEGFKLSGKGDGLGIFGISIFHRDREVVEKIRDAYKAYLSGNIDREERDHFTGNLLLGEHNDQECGCRH